MADNMQTTFLNAFFEWKYKDFDQYFTEACLFPGVELTIFQALVQIMAWSLPGDLPLPEPTMTILFTHVSLGLNELISNSVHP